MKKLMIVAAVALGIVVETRSESAAWQNETEMTKEWPVGIGIVVPAQFPPVRHDVCGFRFGGLLGWNETVRGLDLGLGNENVYSFCQDVLDEIMDIFPANYIHIGGDEAPRDRWAECSKCQAKAHELSLTTNTLQSYFTNRIEKYVNSKGRRIIGWDEILEGPINKSATIMSWRGISPGVEAASKGHDVIMTPNSHLYFDYYQTEGRNGGPILIGGYVPLEKVYSLNPIPDDIPPIVGVPFF